MQPARLHERLDSNSKRARQFGSLGKAFGDYSVKPFVSAEVPRLILQQRK